MPIVLMWLDLLRVAVDPAMLVAMMDMVLITDVEVSMSRNYSSIALSKDMIENWKKWIGLYMYFIIPQSKQGYS